MLGGSHSLRIMLAYEHEMALFISRNPGHIATYLPKDERTDVIFAVFSSYSIYWKQFFAKRIAHDVSGQLKGKKIHIIS